MNLNHGAWGSLSKCSPTVYAKKGSSLLRESTHIFSQKGNTKILRKRKKRLL